jgi:hypothetical protein
MRGDRRRMLTLRTAPEMGWASKSNGELLALAAGEFDAFLMSTGISPTSKISAVDIAVLVLARQCA